MKKLSRGVGMALMAAGAVMAGIVYAVRQKLAFVASSVRRHGKRSAHRAISYLTSYLPSFVFGG